MTNPFKNKPPSELIKMVRGEAVCEKCKGQGYTYKGREKHPWGLETWDCPVCKGSCKQPPLANADLDALTAIHCKGRKDVRFINFYHPTTDPHEAMRLQKKYRIDTLFVRGDEAVWSATVWTETKGIIKRDRVTCYHEDLECAITKAALIAVLMGVLDRG